MHRALWYVVLLLLVAPGCAEDEPAHADNASLPSREHMRSTSSEQTRVIDLQALEVSGNAFSARLEAATKLVEIGQREGDGTVTFGSIAGATADDAGRLLVLDGANGLVKVFSPDSTLLTTFGGLGNGPGELRNPIAIALNEAGEVFVAEQAMEVERYARFLADERPQPLGTTQVNVTVRDFCVSGKHLVVQSTSGALADSMAGTVRVYGEDGVLTATFGAMYDHPSWLLADRMSRGLVACPDVADIVITTPSSYPAVSAYTLQGEELWTLGFKGFSPRSVLEEVDLGGGEKGVRTVRADAPFHVIGGLIEVAGADVVLLQIAEIPEAGSGYFHTFAIKVATGRAKYLGNEVPGLLWVGADRFLGPASEDADYPSVGVFAY